jgi:hypothetical protein
VIRPVDRDEAAHQLHGVGILAQPFARDDHAEAVADDVDLRRAGEGEHGADEAAQVRNIGDGRVRRPGAKSLVRKKVALVALVADTPELAQRVAVIGEVLRERLHPPVRVAHRREGRVIVAVDEDDRRARHRSGSAEADQRSAERGVEDRRKAGRKRVADGAVGMRPGGERKQRAKSDEERRCEAGEA